MQIFRPKFIKMRATQKRQISSFLAHVLFILKVYDFVFFAARNSRYFILNFFTRTHYILAYLFLEYFESEKFEFWKFQNKGLHEAQSPKCPTPNFAAHLRLRLHLSTRPVTTYKSTNLMNSNDLCHPTIYIQHLILLQWCINHIINNSKTC